MAMTSTPRLTCEQCKQRKKKCDKGAPCSSCKHAGLSCQAVRRARLPRGRSGQVRNHSTLLESRVNRIEELLHQVQATQTNGLDNPDPRHDGRSCQTRSAIKTEDFIASEFWTALSDEVAGLREAFEGSDAEGDIREDDFTANGPDETSNQMRILFNATPSSGTSSLRPLSQEVLSSLLETYHHRVDCMYKLLHWPTVSERISTVHNNPEASKSSSESSLEYAMYFMALCSLTDAECWELCSTNRAELIQEYQSSTENFIAQTNLMNHPNVVSLQAFLIYLIGLRTRHNGASAWTLMAIAVRVGNALGLGSEDPRRFSAFDLEVRRRIWYVIGSLDTHSSLDRGMPALLPSTVFGPPPRHIDDCDMSPEGGVGTTSSEWTDMSFSCLSHEVFMCWKRVCEVPYDAGDGWKNWNLKIQLISDFEESAKRRYTIVESTATPIQRLMGFAVQEMVTNLQLMLRRPPYGNSRNVVPPWDDFDVLEVATNVLDGALNIKLAPDLAPWAWKSWVQWLALAVVLAEMCAHPPSTRSHRSYVIARESFNRYERLIADSESGLLWKPITKLMRQVERNIASNSDDLGLPSARASATPSDVRSGDSLPSINASGSTSSAEPVLLDSNLPLENMEWSTVDDAWSALMNGENDQNMTFLELDPTTDAPWSYWDLFLGDLNSATNEI